MPALTSAAAVVDARRARVAVAALFFTNGALLANLIPRYPEIKAGLDLSATAFGTAVAAMPFGALVAGLTAAALIRRFRSSRVAVAATALSAAGFVVAAWSPSWAALAVGMVLAGAADAVTDVAQNSHGLRVQRLYGRSILNSFHAVWSAGFVLGALMGAAAAQVGVPPLLHLSATGVLFTLVAAAAYRWLLPGPEPVKPPQTPATGEQHAAPHRRLRWRTLAPVGLTLGALFAVAASAGVVEDAGATWSAIYLTGLGAVPFVAGLGATALQGMQFVGRLVGDRLVDRFGQRVVARTGGGLVLLGSGAALAVPSAPLTVVGLGLSGLGVATLIPAAMHAADELPGLPAGAGLTIISWLLRVGFLLSPPLVGAVADAASLRVGLLVLPLAGLLVVLFARVLSSAPTRAADTPAAAAP